MSVREQDKEIKGEYVMVAEIEADNFLIRSLTAFQKRNMEMPSTN